MFNSTANCCEPLSPSLIYIALAEKSALTRLQPCSSNKKPFELVICVLNVVTSVS
jgi:hypothetical protein